MIINFKKALCGGGGGSSTTIEALNIIENGVYEAPKGTAYSPVTVDVPIPVFSTEEKTISITSNGQTIVDKSADKDGMTKVTVDVNVPEKTFTTEELTATENKVYTPTADGYSKVTVNVPQPKVEAKKTVEIVSNGTTEINPSADYDGIAGATVQVNVPEKKLQNKTIPEITANGPQSIVPDGGFDGMSKLDFTVNVPSGGGGAFDITGTGWETEPYFPVDLSRTATLNDDIEYTRTKFAEWDPANTSANSLYHNDTKLVYAPKIDTSKVINMSSCFMGCESLTTVPQLDTSKVTDMLYCFIGCQSLTTIPQFDTSKVTNMGGMFDSCSSLTSVPQFDTSNVTDMTSMFNNCTSLTTIPLLDTSKVKSAYGLLSMCSNLTELGGFVGLKVSLDINTDYNLTKLTKQSILNVIAGLGTADPAYEAEPTLSVGSSAMKKLTPAEIKVATDKGWRVSEY